MARSEVDRAARLVLLEDLRVPRVRFSGAADRGYAHEMALSKVLPGRLRALALERIEAEPEILPAEESVEGLAPGKIDGLELRNDPPRIVFSPVPAVLLHVDGTPSWVPVGKSSLKRLLNTRALVLSAPKGPVFLRLFDGWLEGPSIEGPWKVSKKAPAELDAIARKLAPSNGADLGDGWPSRPGDPSAERSLKTGPTPAVVLTTVPTELVVLDGQPSYLPVEGTQLLSVANTTGAVFRHVGDRKVYVLLAGRWFRGGGYDGPWEFVPGKSLPGDFAAIPDTGSWAKVKASVPGTKQALEATASSTVPRVAKVDRTAARLAVSYDGEPHLREIAGTPLRYVMNSPIPVIAADEKSWYAVDRGIWFAAAGPHGPWAVASSVPDDLYTIPPGSPVHRVTYVKIQEVRQDTVYVGATPGYTGTVVNSESVAVHGTGFSYPPWVGTRYFPPPATYGDGAAALTPLPSGRAAAQDSGPGGRGAAVAARGARQAAGGDDCYADRDGEVYRKDAAGVWLRYQPGGWSAVPAGGNGSRH